MIMMEFSERLERLGTLKLECEIAQYNWKNELIDVGAFTYGRPIVLRWDTTTRLTIGKFCSIAQNVQIFLGGEHHTDIVTTYPFDVLIDRKPTPSKGDVIIGNDVWIGNNVQILSGVNIGDGAVIGAGTVVARDVQAYSVVVGNSQRQIRWRMCRPFITIMEQLRWWDWTVEKIAEGYPLIMSADVDGLAAFSKEWDAKHGGDGNG